MIWRRMSLRVCDCDCKHRLLLERLEDGSRMDPCMDLAWLVEDGLTERFVLDSTWVVPRRFAVVSAVSLPGVVLRPR